MAVPIVNRCHQVRQGHALEVLAALEDAVGGFQSALAIERDRDQPHNGLAVARGCQALAPRGAVEQPGQDASGRGSADLVHRGPRFGFA